MTALWAAALTQLAIAAAPDCATLNGYTPTTELQAGVAGQQPGSVMLELHVTRSVSAQQVTALTAAAHAQGAVLVLRVDPEAADARSSALREAADDGHIIAAHLAAGQQFGSDAAALPHVDAIRWRRSISSARKSVKQAASAPVRTVSVDLLVPVSEMVLDESGVRIILPDTGDSQAVPRVARAYGDQIGHARVIPPLPYVDGCGHTMPDASAAAWNRVTTAADGREGLRVVLHPQLDPELLQRWLRDIAPSAGITVLNYDGIKRLVDRPLLAMVNIESVAPPPPPPSGKTVDLSTLKNAATDLLTPTRLPRQAGEGLSLTECFAGMVIALAAPALPATVRLPPLGPPADVARSTLNEGWAPTKADVHTAAAGLASNLRGSVPAVVLVGDQTVAAREFLVLMAQVIAGKAPAPHAVSDPDPYARGAGWGRSGLDPNGSN